MAIQARCWKIAALLAASTGLAAWQGARPLLDRAAVAAMTDADAIAIERHFIVGFGDLQQARDFVHLGHVRGVFLTRRNVVGLNKPDLTAMVSGGSRASTRASGSRR